MSEGLVSGVISTGRIMALRSRAINFGLDLTLGQKTRDGKFQLFQVTTAESVRVKRILSCIPGIRYGKAKPIKEVRNTIVGRKPQAHGQHGE